MPCNAALQLASPSNEFHYQISLPKQKWSIMLRLPKAQFRNSTQRILVKMRSICRWYDCFSQKHCRSSTAEISVLGVELRLGTDFFATCDMWVFCKEILARLAGSIDNTWDTFLAVFSYLSVQIPSSKLDQRGNAASSVFSFWVWKPARGREPEKTKDFQLNYCWQTLFFGRTSMSVV